MSEQAPDKIWSGIQLNKVIAGTLAAVAAATLGSFLGVAGTLAGAALASIIGSVGTEIFSNSLKRGTKHLQTAVAPTFIKAPAAVGTPPVEAASEEENPAHTVAAEEKPPLKERLANVHWKRVGIATATLFVLAMGSVLVFEFATGKPLSATVKNQPAAGTTLFGSTGTATTTESDSDEGGTGSTPQESSEPSQAPDADSSDPATEPTDGGTTTAPTPTPTETTTTPGNGPTTEPGTGENTGDTGSGSTGDSTTGDNTGSGGGGEQPPPTQEQPKDTGSSGTQP